MSQRAWAPYEDPDETHWELVAVKRSLIPEWLWAAWAHSPLEPLMRHWPFQWFLVHRLTQEERTDHFGEGLP